MKSILKMTLLLLLIAALAALYWYYRDPLSNACRDNAELTVSEQKSCQKRIAKVVNKALIGSHPITIDLPENSAKVTLNKTQYLNHILYLRGDYQVLLQEASAQQEGLYDKGLVLLNLAKVTLLNRQQDSLLYFAAPFVINVAGSGVFFYVGLFSYDLQSQQSEHLDSLFLGDRIIDKHIELINNEVRVSFLQHGKEQTMSDYPNQLIEKNLQLLNLFQPNGKAKFKEVKRMHSSWDKNRDGINDCENDGTCDHSVDYSQARPASKGGL